MWQILFLLLGVGLPAAPPEPPFGDAPVVGDLVITELMIDPEATPDWYGEYLEVVNVSSRRLQLLGLVVRDERRDWCPITESLVLEPGESLVIARKWSPTLNGGFFPRWLCNGRNLALANGSDSVVLDWYGIAIDEVSWQEGEWLVPAGRALELDPLCADAAINDEPGAWFPARMPMAGGDYGSPGRFGDLRTRGPER